MTDEKTQTAHAWLTEHIPTMEGWLSPERALEMYDLVRTMQPSYVVEIGVFGGRSLVAQGLALRDNGRGKIIGIDPWKKQVAMDANSDDSAASAWWANVDYYQIHQGCMNVIWSLGLDPFVNVIRSCSEHCFDIVPKCDILYIDGGHSEEISCRDVSLFLPKVKQNGYIWADDMDWKSTQKAKALLLEQCVIVNDSGNYILFCKK